LTSGRLKAALRSSDHSVAASDKIKLGDLAVNRRGVAGEESAQLKSAGGLAMNHHFSLESPTNEIESRRCATCGAEMVPVRITPARLGFNAQAFECVGCGHFEKVLIAADPIQSSVLGWLLSELRPPS
jgi:hypothetical protein